MRRRVKSSRRRRSLARSTKASTQRSRSRSRSNGIPCRPVSRRTRTSGVHQPLLEARGLVYEYPGGLRALDGIDLALESGELAVAIGPNGSGKSTLIKLLAGLLQPQAGSVML